jgi:hypothetical protein
MNANRNGKEILELLNGLGGSSVEVAQTLLNKGSRGEIGDGLLCPIANYLREQGIEFQKVCSVEIWWEGEVRLGVPKPVAIFIRAFDAGVYPELKASS